MINLNEVQRAYINETVRPMIERIIKMRDDLDAFVIEADNQQTPIPNVADTLGDGPNGTAARADAPVLQGTHVTQLRNFAAGMRDQINGAALNSLVALAVRDYSTITRGL